jgi:CheY-like chemotaxis protein
LPAVAETKGEPRPVPPSKPTRSRGDAVLVIDDNPTAREVLQQFLRRKGFRAEAAATGEEGLRLARELHPLVIMLDVVMPGMDGWAVLTALKADPKLADIPVVLFTGMGDDRQEAFRLGASDYLVKPVDPDRLVAVLGRYCGGTQRALVVDDDAALRLRLRGLLEQGGWEVDEAGDGREALGRLAGAKPGLILLDLLMPGMDGFEFLGELQRQEGGGSVPVLILTAKDLTAVDQQRLSGPLAKVIQKGSLGPEQLLAEVRALLGGGHQHR